MTEIQVEFRCVVGKTRISPSIRIPTNLCRTFYGTHLDAPLPPCRTPIAGYALGNTAVIFPVIQTAVRSRISRTSHDLRERSRISFVNSLKCTASQKQISPPHSIVDPGKNLIFIEIRIVVKYLIHLAHIAHAADLLCLSLCLVQRRQKHCRKNCDDRNNNQKLYHSKTCRFTHKEMRKRHIPDGAGRKFRLFPPVSHSISGRLFP